MVALSLSGPGCKERSFSYKIPGREAAFRSAVAHIEGRG